MKLVKVTITGGSNKFNERRPNSLIFVCHTEDLTGAVFYLKDSSYARADLELYCDKVVFHETINI